MASFSPLRRLWVARVIFKWIIFCYSHTKELTLKSQPVITFWTELIPFLSKFCISVHRVPRSNFNVRASKWPNNSVSCNMHVPQERGIGWGRIFEWKNCWHVVDGADHKFLSIRYSGLPTEKRWVLVWAVEDCWNEMKMARLEVITDGHPTTESDPLKDFQPAKTTTYHRFSLLMIPRLVNNSHRAKYSRECSSKFSLGFCEPFSKKLKAERCEMRKWYACTRKMSWILWPGHVQHTCG